MQRPHLPLEYILAIGQARARGRAAGAIFADCVLDIGTVEAPLAPFWRILKAQLIGLSAGARVACVEAASIEAAQRVASRRPGLTVRSVFRSAVFPRGTCMMLLDHAEGAGLDVVINAYELETGLALRADSMSTDICRQGYNGEPVDRDLMHALAVAAWSVDLKVLAESVQFLTSTVIYAAVNLDVDAETFSRIWTECHRHADIDMQSLLRLVEMPAFVEAVRGGLVKPSPGDQLVTDAFVHAAQSPPAR